MITLKHILVPYDFSEASEAGIKYGRDLGTLSGARLHVLHVNTPDKSEVRDSTGEDIVRYAREHDIDLIVLGTQGPGRVPHVLTGSVTEMVVRTAPCPVLTLPWWSFAVAVEPRRSSEAIAVFVQRDLHLGSG